MAKPIKSTPELTGEEANKFLKKMLFVERSKVTKKQKDYAREIKANMESLLVC